MFVLTLTGTLNELIRGSARRWRRGEVSGNSFFLLSLIAATLYSSLLLVLTSGETRLLMCHPP